MHKRRCIFVTLQPKGGEHEPQNCGRQPPERIQDHRATTAIAPNRALEAAYGHAPKACPIRMSREMRELTLTNRLQARRRTASANAVGNARTSTHTTQWSAHYNLSATSTRRHNKHHKATPYSKRCRHRHCATNAAPKKDARRLGEPRRTNYRTSPTERSTPITMTHKAAANAIATDETRRAHRSTTNTTYVGQRLRASRPAQWRAHARTQLHKPTRLGQDARPPQRA